jgi:CubicO group peptidase (beta-lactamase class C family)
MSGGLPTDDPWADRHEPMTTEAFDAMSRDGFRLITIPGTAYEYSNLGFALIGRLIEKLAGRSYIEVVHEEILAPLGVSGIGYDTGVEGTDGIATGYVRRAGEWLPMPEPGPGAFSPIGGMYASARGLAAWASWLSDGFTVASDSSSVLGRPTRREMQQARRTMAIEEGGLFLGRGYGYGLVAELDAHGRRIVSHSGGYPGFGSHMRWNPESGVGIVAFENVRYGPVYQLATTALELILNAMPVPTEVKLWPETAAAREAVEQLLVTWDDTLAASFSAPNLHMDEPFPLRRLGFEALVEHAGISAGSLRPLAESDPTSESGAHVAWTVTGRAGAVRVEIRMTPEARPLVETLNATAL